MSDMSLKRIRYIIDYLIQEGYLEVDEMNYRTVQPTPKTKEILNGKELSMKLIKEVSYIHKKDTVLTSEEDRLFERLKKLRNRRAVMQVFLRMLYFKILHFVKCAVNVLLRTANF